jgi:secondary thiamine-phosphate synthase enzyme
MIQQERPRVRFTRLNIDTEGHNHIVNLTDALEEITRSMSLRDGTLICFVTATTAGLTVIEDEPGVRADLRQAMERLIPTRGDYIHHRTAGDDNGHSHVRAALLGPSLAIPVIDGRPALGTWQQIVLVDFDSKPRRREIIVQGFGE